MIVKSVIVFVEEFPETFSHMMIIDNVGKFLVVTDGICANNLFLQLDLSVMCTRVSLEQRIVRND